MEVPITLKPLQSKARMFGNTSLLAVMFDMVHRSTFVTSCILFIYFKAQTWVWDLTFHLVLKHIWSEAISPACTKTAWSLQVGGDNPQTWYLAAPSCCGLETCALGRFTAVCSAELAAPYHRGTIFCLSPSGYCVQYRLKDMMDNKRFICNILI